MYVVVVQKLTFAISSPDEFLSLMYSLASGGSMFNQPLLPCRGSAVQAAARGRAVPCCWAHMNIQWLANVSPWGPSALITRGHTHSRRHGLRRVEYSTTGYIVKYCTMWS